MRLRETAALSCAVALLLPLLGAAAQTKPTLEQVRERGSLRCGVAGNLPGMSLQGAGSWSGLDVDLCRAVAAAALGDADKVTYVPLTNQDRLDALAADRIDLLARNTTWNMQRDLTHGMTFVGVSYYDGQGMMVPRDSGLRSALELDGATVCVLRDTTSLDNAKRYFARNRMRLKLLQEDTFGSAMQAYAEGRCTVLTGDQTQLYASRAEMADPAAHRILPEIISKEPLSPAVRKNDAQWHDLVRWTLFALIDAEEMGISSGNVERIREQAQSPDVRAFLGLDANGAAGLGLAQDWAYQVIRQVGNYGELYQRNLEPLGIKRGLNALWRDGGLMYAPPVQ